MPPEQTPTTVLPPDTSSTPFLKSKVFRVSLTGALAVFVVGVVVAFSFLFLQWKEYRSIQTDIAPMTGELAAPGMPVETAVYDALQASLVQRFSSTNVKVDTVRAYDIDGDGDDDIVGFMDFVWEEGQTPTYKLTTWHKNEGEYTYYEDAYADFRFGGEKNCTLKELAVGSIVLTCSEGGLWYDETLQYQENGIGYYRNVDAQVKSTTVPTGWVEYRSTTGGIRFMHPSDVEVRESTYDAEGVPLTIISATRGDHTLFEIHSEPYGGADAGGGIIPPDRATVFLKLADGTYLSRRQSTQSLESPFVLYERTTVRQQNNAGSFFDSFEAVNASHGRRYILVAVNGDERGIEEVDTIFASISYTDAPAAPEIVITPREQELTLFDDLISLKMPGDIGKVHGSSSVPIEAFELSLIDSFIYRPASLTFELHPFGSVGQVTAIGGGGYNAELGQCYRYVEERVSSAPQQVGGNMTCQFGWGDAGISGRGYYILDPKHRYILAITEDASAFGQYSLLSPDLEAIVASVRFAD